MMRSLLEEMYRIVGLGVGGDKKNGPRHPRRSWHSFEDSLTRIRQHFKKKDSVQYERF